MALLAVALTLAAPQTASVGVGSDPAALLRTAGAPPGVELAAVERGATLAKVIDTTDRSEVFTLSAMRVTTTAERALAVLGGDGSGGAPWVLQFGRLSDPPAPGDFERMTLDAGDVKQLAKCRSKECDVRLPAEVIERFRREVDWSASAQTRAVNDLFRNVMVAYTRSYLAHGDTALFEYANKEDSVRIAASLQLLVHRMPFLSEIVPEAGAFLDGAPVTPSSGVRESLYWMKEKFWAVNVLSLNHRVVVDRMTDAGRMIVAVVKQLYANRYYESSLRAIVFLETKDRGSYLVLVGRARADIRRAGFNRVERALLRMLVRGRLEAELRFFKQQLLEP